MTEDVTEADDITEAEEARLARKARRQERRRRRILDAATDLLVEGGPESLTMAALAERADTSPSTLYYYLPGREAVLDAITADIVEADSDAQMAALAATEGLGGVESLCAVMDARAHLMAEDPERLGALYLHLVTVRVSEDVLRERVYPAAWRVMSELERRLRADQEAGRVHPDLDPRRFANVGFFATQGILTMWLGMKRMGGALLFSVDELMEESKATVRRAARLA